MSLDAPLIDYLWNSEYGDRLDFKVPSPHNKSGVCNVRTLNNELVEIEINPHLTDGLYLLTESARSNPDKLEIYNFIHIQQPSIALNSLKALLERGKPKTVHRSIKIDNSTLTRQQRKLLEDLFHHPVFEDNWNVMLSANRSEVETDFTITRQDLNRVFSPTNIGSEESEEVPTYPDVHLVVTAGERGVVTYNLSELYESRIIEVDGILDLLEELVETRRQDVKNVRRNHERSFDNRKLDQDRARVKERHLKEHLMNTLVQHNPNIIVEGEGSDYINYRIEVDVVRLPFVVEDLESLYRAVLPGVVGCTGLSASKKEAIRQLYEAVELETQIKPLTEQEVQQLRVQRFHSQTHQRHTVEYAEFNISVNKGRKYHDA